MQGWRTLLLAVGVTLAGVAQTFDWETVIPQDKTWSGVAMIAVGGAIAALRAMTTTPIGQSK